MTYQQCSEWPRVSEQTTCSLAGVAIFAIEVSIDTLSWFGSTLTLSLMTDDLPTSKLQNQRVSMLLLVQSPWTLYLNNSGIVSAFTLVSNYCCIVSESECGVMAKKCDEHVLCADQCGTVLERAMIPFIHIRNIHWTINRILKSVNKPCIGLFKSRNDVPHLEQIGKTRNSSIRMALLILFRVTQNQRYCSIVHYLELRGIYV